MWPDVLPTLCDELSHGVEVVPARPGGVPALAAQHGSSHGLVVHAADGGGSSVTADVVERGDRVHVFPLGLQWSVLRVVGADWLPTP
jgi:hypothetical protein